MGAAVIYEVIKHGLARRKPKKPGATKLRHLRRAAGMCIEDTRRSLVVLKDRCGESRAEWLAHVRDHRPPLDGGMEAPFLNIRRVEEDAELMMEAVTRAFENIDTMTAAQLEEAMDRCRHKAKRIETLAGLLEYPSSQTSEQAAASVSGTRGT